MRKLKEFKKMNITSNESREGSKKILYEKMAQKALEKNINWRLNRMRGVKSDT